MSNTARKIRRRRQMLQSHWDFIATKSLILGTPEVLLRDLRATLDKLSIKWSSRNRAQYCAALKRATGYDAHNFAWYGGTATGRWSYTATQIQQQQQIAAAHTRKLKGYMESWIDEAYSKTLDSPSAAHTCSGTCTPCGPDGESLPVTDPTNSSGSV